MTSHVTAGDVTSSGDNAISSKYDCGLASGTQEFRHRINYVGALPPVCPASL